MKNVICFIIGAVCVAVPMHIAMSRGWTRKQWFVAVLSGTVIAQVIVFVLFSILITGCAGVKPVPTTNRIAFTIGVTHESDVIQALGQPWHFRRDAANPAAGLGPIRVQMTYRAQDFQVPPMFTIVMRDGHSYEKRTHPDQRQGQSMFGFTFENGVLLLAQ